MRKKFVIFLIIVFSLFLISAPVFAADELGGGLITKCGNQSTPSGDCADVSIFLLLAINIANYLFTFIGALALAVFVYGGVMMIISGGSSEKVKKGTDAMVAAIIGLIIAFSAYVLVDFLGKSLNIKSEYLISSTSTIK